MMMLVRTPLAAVRVHVALMRSIVARAVCVLPQHLSPSWPCVLGCAVHDVERLATLLSYCTSKYSEAFGDWNQASGILCK